MTDLERIRALLAHHLDAQRDPCQDRGVEWPCDVADALTHPELGRGTGWPPTHHSRSRRHRRSGRWLTR